MARLLFVLGQVALLQLRHLEAVQSELERRRGTADGGAGPAKAAAQDNIEVELGTAAMEEEARRHARGLEDRARLAQAFGRLIRNKDDHGHFVVLSAAFPSRLLSAFPEGTTVRRLTLDEAIARIGGGLIGADEATGQNTPDEAQTPE